MSTSHFSHNLIILQAIYYLDRHYISTHMEKTQHTHQHLLPSLKMPILYFVRYREGRERVVVGTQINKMTNSETNLNLLRPPPYIGPNLFYQHCGRRKNYRQYFSISFPYLHFSQHL